MLFFEPVFFAFHPSINEYFRLFKPVRYKKTNQEKEVSFVVSLRLKK